MPCRDDQGRLHEHAAPHDQPDESDAPRAQGGGCAAGPFDGLAREIVARARSSAGLSNEEAMAIALRETRLHRAGQDD